MKTLQLTKSELLTLAGMVESPQHMKSVRYKAQRALGYSIPMQYDQSSENFVKRIIYYMEPNNPAIKDIEVTGKWLTMLTKRANVFLKGNRLELSEELAMKLSTHTPNEYKNCYPNHKYVFQLYRGIQAFINKEFPPEDTLIGQIIKTILSIVIHKR